jgi:uncharacterized repeat protein (TIGR01451 family)
VARAAPTLASGTVLTNQVRITTSTSGDDPGDNTSTTSTTVVRADVAVTKASPTSFPVPAGSQVTYTIDYTNIGPATASNVVLTDPMPAQLTGVSWSCTTGCTGSGTGSITLPLGNLAAGAGGRITVTGTAMTTLEREDFVNVARITTSTPETSTTNNESAVPGAVWTSDLLIIKDADLQAVAGTTFSATLTIRNQGPSPAPGVVVEDVLPAGVTFVSSTPPPTSSTGATYRWDLGTLGDLEERTITLTLRAAADLDGGTALVNTATVTAASDRDPTNNRDNSTTVVRRQADLRISKDGPARVTAGRQIVYTLTYQNDGPSTARAAVVTDTLPPGVTFVSASPPPTSQSGGILTWNVGNLAVGQSGTITITVATEPIQVQPAITVLNEATITDGGTDQPGGGGVNDDPDPTNNRDDSTTDIETADVLVIKDMPEFIVAGVPFTATVRVENRGPADAQDVTLRDFLPPGMTVVQATPPVSVAPARWNLGTLPAGQVVTVTLRLRVPSTTPRDTPFVNRVSVDASTPDRDERNNIHEDSTIVRPNADLSVVKDGPAGPVPSGSTVTYTLTWANAGPSQAVQVQIRDTLPEGFTLDQASPPPTGQSGNTLTWNLGDVDTGMSGTITLRGRLLGDGVTTVRVNEATITSTTDDPDPDNNTDDHPITVHKPDLRVTKSNGVTNAQPGDLLTYRIIVTNAGLVDARGVVVTETPPAGDVRPGDGWQSTQTTHTQTIPLLGAGETVTLTMRVQLPNPLPAGMERAVNVVTVTDDGSAGPDPTPDDNRATDDDPLIWGSVGDFIWIDRNRNGVPDPGEPGLGDVPLELLDPRTNEVLGRVTTATDGSYRFGGLRLGTYAIRITPEALAGRFAEYTITTAPIPVTALTTEQREDMDLDIGLYSPTAAVELTYLRAERQADGTVRIRWGTRAERDTDRFVVKRTRTPTLTANAVIVGERRSIGSRGGDYEVIDANAPAPALFYWLVEVETGGTENVYGPASTAPTTSGAYQVVLPLIRR